MPKDSQIGKKDNYISKMQPFGKLVKTIERKYNVTILYDQEKYKNNKLNCKIRPRRNDRRSIIHFGRDTAKHEIQKK